MILLIYYSQLKNAIFVSDKNPSFTQFLAFKSRSRPTTHAQLMCSWRQQVVVNKVLNSTARVAYCSVCRPEHLSCAKQLISTMEGADRPYRQTECLLAILLATCCCLIVVIQSNSTQDQSCPYLTPDLPQTEEANSNYLLVTGTILPLPSDLCSHSHDRSILVTGRLEAPPSQPVTTQTVTPESTLPSTRQDFRPFLDWVTFRNN